MKSVSTLINFVDGTPGGSVTPSTSDSLTIALALLFVAVTLVLLAIGAILKKKNGSMFRTNSSDRTSSSTLVKPMVLKVVFIAIAAIALIFSLLGISSLFGKSAYASNSANAELTAPSTVNAYVDKNAGTVTIENGFLINETENVVTVNEVKAILADGVDAGGCN